MCPVNINAGVLAFRGVVVEASVGRIRAPANTTGNARFEAFAVRPPVNVHVSVVASPP